jgi:putative SOS response-associated peptidase YedK
MLAAMCGRFALGIPGKRLEEVFGLHAPDDYAPSFNVAPYPARAMRAWPVNRRVNSPVTDGPELLEPAPENGPPTPLKQSSLL